jgi:hypothetical protein
LCCSLAGVWAGSQEQVRERIVNIVDDVVTGFKASEKSAMYAKYTEAVDHSSLEVRAAAIEISRGCALDDQCRLEHILEYVSNSVEYVRDPSDVELIQHPVWTLTNRAGDCEDQSILLVSLLESVDIETLLAFADNHVMPVACLSKPVDEGFLADSAVVLLRGDRFCYPLEPTAPNASIGYSQGWDDVHTLVESVGGHFSPLALASGL